MKDQALLAYFKQVGDTKKVAIVTDRMTTIRQELAEM